jgi:glycosyltransferase involved in cell wall biosynthesis
LKKIKKKKEEIGRKLKVLTLGDNPLMPSGVGTQTKYICQALLDSGEYTVYSLAGARQHLNYQPVQTEQYGSDWTIHPVDGYGNAASIRGILAGFKPDILWFMTDPRFYEWLWDIEDEIRPNVPMVYYHVWDNHPAPTFNKGYYNSTDVIHSISKITRDIVDEVVGEGFDHKYVPHCVDQDIFNIKPEEEVNNFIEEFIPAKKEGKVVYFWNNRNGRRKMPGSLMFWFKDFLDEVGHDKATLIMHTEPKDDQGQDLAAIADHLGLVNGEIVFSTQKYEPEVLSYVYNSVDCTINIADAEGFGLSSLESLNCGTPVINNLTGGLTEQVFDGETYFGVGIEPKSRAVIGSQAVPWIYEDRIAKEDFIEALKTIYNMTDDERKELGLKGRDHMLKNYNFNKFKKFWPEEFERIHRKYGSWPTKNYNSWELREI